MKLSIKLQRYKSALTDKGYPVIVYIAHNYKEKRVRTGYYAHEKEWSDKLAGPTRKHPDYHNLYQYIAETKEKIAEIHLESTRRNLDFEYVTRKLFQKNSDVFYEIGLRTVKKGSTQYSALRSFNRFYPEIQVDRISKGDVIKYKDSLLKTNSPGGVDSYIRSLRSVWNKNFNKENPFSGIKIEIPRKINVVASPTDLGILKNAELQGVPNDYRNYWLLMFYMGGIDPEVLSKLRYDRHLVNGRINFNRNKGNSKAFCSNLVPEEAFEILEQYDCKPYFVPIYKYRNYKHFLDNFRGRFKKVCSDLRLSMELRPKSARYTFIDRGQQLLVDERIVAEIVGHSRRTVTSLYTNSFPLATRDAAHLRIIRS